MENENAHEDGGEFPTSIGLEGGVPFEFTPALSELMRAHVRYQSELGRMDQYLIWRYTMGSGALTRALVGAPDPESDLWWAFDVFAFYDTEMYGLEPVLGSAFARWARFFVRPKALLAAQGRGRIAAKVIATFAREIERIVSNAPPTPGDIRLYKTASRYPGLPAPAEAIESRTVRVRCLSSARSSSAGRSGKDIDDGDRDTVLAAIEQKPFNSASFDPQLNFGLFLSPESSCCAFVLDVPRGSRLLLVDPSLHAYPFEREAILPTETVFVVESSVEGLIGTIPSQTQMQLVKVQRGPPYVIGEVYRVDPASCERVERRAVTIFGARVETPLSSPDGRAGG